MRCTNPRQYHRSISCLCDCAHTNTTTKKKVDLLYIVHYRSFVHICSYVPGKVCMVNGIEPGCLVHAWNQKTEQAEHQIRPWSSTLRCRHFRLWNKRDIHLSRLGLLFGLVFESQERNGRFTTVGRNPTLHIPKPLGLTNDRRRTGVAPSFSDECG